MVDIARVNRTRRTTEAPKLNNDPNQFGAGTARALSGFSTALNSLGDSGDDLGMSEVRLGKAQADRERRVETADARSRWIELTSQFDMETESSFRETDDVMLKGWTDQVSARADAMEEEFLDSLSPEVRREFEADTTLFKTQRAMSAYTTQRGAEDNELLRRTTALITTGVDQITNLEDGTDPRIIEGNVWAKIEYLIDDLPFSEADKAELRRQADENLNRALLWREGYEQARGNLSEAGSVPGRIRREGKLDVADNPVATGLSSTAAGFLNFIAGPESSNAYNIMYSPDGQRTFDEYGAHPNNAAVIASGPNAGKNSTAAGRYQFINGTWQRVAAATGLSDFSPESQDRGAWWLAKQDYMDRTGRDLEYDLRSGNDATLARVIEAMGGTWEALAKMDPEKGVAALKAALGGAEGTPTVLENAPRYANLPRQERQEILQSGQQKALLTMSQQAAEFETRQAQLLENMRQRIVDGDNSVTEASIRNVGKMEKFSVQETEALIKSYRDVNAERIAANTGLSNILEERADTVDNKRKDFDAAFNYLDGPTRFRERDEEFAEGYTQLAIKANQVTPGQKGMLLGMISSQNPEDGAYAYGILANIQRQRPNALSSFSDAERQQFALYGTLMEAGVPQQQITEHLRLGQDPQTASMREMYKKRFDDELKDNVSMFNPDQVINMAGLGSRFGADPDLLMTEGLQRESRALLEYNFSKTGDWDLARKATEKQLQQTWGTTMANGEPQAMKYPPEKVLPAYAGKHDWVQQQFKQDVGVDSAELLTDTQTKRELEAGSPPSWQLVKDHELGYGKVPMQIKDLANWKDVERKYKGKVPDSVMEIYGEVDARWTGDYNPDRFAAQQVMEVRAEEARIEQTKEDNPRATRGIPKGTDPVVEFLMEQVSQVHERWSEADRAMTIPLKLKILNGVASKEVAEFKQLRELGVEARPEAYQSVLKRMALKVQNVPERSGRGRNTSGLSNWRRANLLDSIGYLAWALAEETPPMLLEEEFPLESE